MTNRQHAKAFAADLIGLLFALVFLYCLWMGTP